VAIARQTGTNDFNRIGLFDPTTQKTLKDRKARLRDLGFEELLVKDLGPQLGWRTVYIIEYLGPLLFHPMFATDAVRSRLYPALYPYVKGFVPLPASPDGTGPLSYNQKLVFVCMMLHFFKREYETIFVHKFSANTMPARNVFRNSFFYWAVAGLLAGFEVYAPYSPTAVATDGMINAIGLGLFAFGEIGNLLVHRYLASLRKPGGTERQIPYGYGFSLVTSPNYMYEIIAWIGLILISRSPSVVIFISFGTMYMYDWAKGKERAYRKEFGDKYKKKRYGILPGLL
jgi:very-long-chain enoyl-CoA reductase